MTPDLFTRYRRLLAALWIIMVILVPLGLTAIEGTLNAYALEKFTTHTREGLVVKRGAAVRRDEYILMMAVLLGAAAATGTALALFICVTLQHWRRVTLSALILALPIVTATLLAFFWYGQAPHLIAWGATHIALFTGVQIVASAIVLLTSPKSVSWLTRLLVPPALRP